MNKKTIVISEDVYERLDEERRSGEEFEDTIDRLIGYRPLSDFFGAWNDETAELARAAIQASRRAEK